MSAVMRSKMVTYVVALMIALLFPTAAMAAKECKEDKQKFCKDVPKADVQTCLKQHEAELSAACRSSREAKKKSSGDAANMGEEEGTHAKPNHGSPTENDATKDDQPDRSNTPSGDAKPQ